MESKKSVWDSSRTGSPALPTHYSSSRPASPLPSKGYYSRPSSPRSVHRSPPRRSGSPLNVPLLSRRMQLYVTRGAALFLLVLGLLAASLLMRQAELTNRSGRKSQYPFHHHFGPGSHSVSAGSGDKDVVGVDENLDLEGLPRLGVSRTMMNRWAQYAPWMPAGGYLAPPVGCAISQVNLLQRHGARYPTSHAGEEIENAIKKLLLVEDYQHDNLEFLNSYHYELGENDLIPFGAKQSFTSGKDAWSRYSHLVNGSTPPFVRASGSERVILSAQNWTAGFANASVEVVIPNVDVIIPEGSDRNNTLDDGMCPNAGDSDDQDQEWLSIFAPPIAARLNQWAPGAHLKEKDVYGLMSMCAFHTLSLESRSPFCALFTEADFEGYEYRNDLDKFYGTGYGQKLGRVQGVGYVNELLARLTGQPVADNTQTNRTLDSSPDRFPLDRAFYADFSHDNEMIAIYAALGLFRQHQLTNETLNPTSPDSSRTWIASRLVPFGARMVVEKMECDARNSVPAGSYVRIFVNDALQPLEFCAGREEEAGVGMCSLEAFVESQAYARSDGGGDFEKCFEDD